MLAEKKKHIETVVQVAEARTAAGLRHDQIIRDSWMRCVHDHKLDPTKKVHVECEISTAVVRISISDEGAGFDPASVPDCTVDERLEAPGGRGVMLMKSFMTSIEYNATGNAVVLLKRRS